MSNVPEPVAAKGGLAAKLKTAQEAAVASAGFTQGPTQSTSKPRVIASAPTPVKPVKSSKDEVLFQATKTNLGAQFGERIIKFKSGYYMTADAAVIKYLRANAQHFGLTEVE